MKIIGKLILPIIIIVLWVLFGWIKQTYGDTNNMPPYYPTIDMAIIEMDLVLDLMEAMDTVPVSDAPTIPPGRFVPFPIALPEGGWSNGADVDVITVTQFVMAVEYQTNAAHGSIMEFQTVYVTNYVPRFPKQLYIQPTMCETVDGEYKAFGNEIIIKLHDTQTGFYSVKLRIE